MNNIGHNSYEDLPERRRVAAIAFAGVQAERDFLVDMRKPTLEMIRQEIMELEKVNKTDAERKARISPKYLTYLEGLKQARKATGEAWAEVTYLDQRFKEWQGLNATAREEMRMHR